MSDKWNKPQEVSDALLAFPAGILHLMPPREEIPENFLNKQKWDSLFRDWFYAGVQGLQFIPREGVDPEMAMRHLQTIMGSYEPKHEHKEEAWAYLASRWFEDATWEREKRKP